MQAVSSAGNKLLVVIEELAEKSKYSKYLGDLEGKERPRPHHLELFFSLADTNIGQLQLEALIFPTNHQRATKLRFSNWARGLGITYSFSHQKQRDSDHN